MYKRDLVKDFFSKEIKFKGIERELKVEDIGKIISIVGPRRSGKTWYFYYLYEKFENPMYVNFEDIAFKDLKPEEFFDVIKIFTELNYEPKTIFLDEVQEMKGWGKLVRSLHDRGYKLFITGSSSKLLPKEILTEIRGRTLTYFLFPFSFREFLRAKKFKFYETFEGKGKLLRYLREYLEYGGYPEVVLTEDKEIKEKILKEYFDEIFYKDFVERHGIRSLDFGRFLFEFCFQNYTKEISFRKIREKFYRKISFSTLYSYIEKLQDTLVVFFVRKYSKSVYTRESWPKKIYLCDTGISTIVSFSEDIGKKMENSVFVDLQRLRNKDPFIEVFYYKIDNKDIDFLVKRKDRIDLIEVTYEKDEEHIRKLIKAMIKLKIKESFLITWDEEDEIKREGKIIKVIPLWKWLLYRNVQF